MGLAIQIEDMAFEAKTLRSMVLAVYEAIYNNNNHADYMEFDGVLNAVFLMAHDHMEHMNELEDKAYTMQREGGKAAPADAGTGEG